MIILKLYFLFPYKFKIINQGNLDYKFDLKLVIDADYTATHGCNDKQLSADYIMIKFNDEEPVVLSSLTDNVIKSNIELKAERIAYYTQMLRAEKITLNYMRKLEGLIEIR